MGWSDKDLQRLKAKGLKVEDPKNGADPGIGPRPKRAKAPRKEPKGLQFIKRHLWTLKIEFKEELRFHATRKFRFDVAVPSMMLAIEYEGIFSEKSRHTGIKGYVGDIEKYNLAQLRGWTVLRYTAKNYGSFPGDLEEYRERTRK